MAGSVYLTRTGLNAYAATPEERRQRGDDVLRWLASGEIKPHIDSTFALEDAAQAHRAIESRGTIGKVCCCRINANKDSDHGGPHHADRRLRRLRPHPRADGRIGEAGRHRPGVHHRADESGAPRPHGRELAFDVCELNLPTYLIARDSGVPITAIPDLPVSQVPPRQRLHQHAIGHHQAEHLIGKRIGSTTLQPASNVWINGILQERHGVPHREQTWVVEREEDARSRHRPGSRSSGRRAANRRCRCCSTANCRR